MDTLTRSNKHSDIIFVGVDTHKDTHTAVAVNYHGIKLDTLTIATDNQGFQQLDDWADSLGIVETYGVEGTGCYGKTLARHLTSNGCRVVEINRVNSQHRRHHGKTDETDAHGAARAVASGDLTRDYKQSDGHVEVVRVIHMARSSAIKSRTTTVNQMKALLVTADQKIVDEIGGLTSLKQAKKASCWRTRDYLTDPVEATRHTLKTLAKRWIELTEEIKQHDNDLKQVLNENTPELIELQGVGVDVAAKLITAAGSNPQRLETQAAFAALCGVSPVDCSSGMQQRHRLNRGGNRQANNALYTIALTRMRHNPETKQYVTRKQGEGKTRKEIIRLLKRHIARQIHKILNKKLT